MIGEVGIWLGDFVTSLQGLLPSAGAFWDGLKGFGNSAFITSLAGAFAGAYGAQKIALRSKIRDEVVKEIKETNSAIMLALTITNLGVALRKQHIKRLITSYHEHLKRAEDHLEGIRNGSIERHTPLNLPMDFSTLQAISPPIKYLEEIILGKLSTAGRFVATVTALGDGVNNLNETLQKRNDLIGDYKANRLPAGAAIHHLYLGWKYEGNKVNNDYSNTISAIDHYLNDVVFFGMTLCEELQVHGQRIAAKNKKHLRGAPSDVMTVDFSEARESGLIPDAGQYKDWTSGFVEKAQPVKRWWTRSVT
jgi:hypothetical protein